jgi:glycosyltransferase involved in cell wall biosynthesis
MRSYAIITPVRDEADNLPRLAASLAAQAERPRTWVIVDNGSQDATVALAHGLAAEHDWIRVLSVPGATAAERGAPIVRALHAAIDHLESDPPDFVVNVDADISMEPDYFARLLERFDADPSLGIASGSGYELEEEGDWRQRHVTGSTVWGASRCFRWACLQEILPFEERVAWDGIDEFKANARGWTTIAFEELPFKHHRREGERDGSTWRARRNQGHAAYYVGYRPWYLILRALFNARREPASLGMIVGYLSAAGHREPRSGDADARAYLRNQQSVRSLRVRSLEATGRRDRAA